jgi:hypothetical protein
MDQIVQLVNRGDGILRMTHIDAAAPRRSTPCARRAASIAPGVFFLEAPETHTMPSRRRFTPNEQAATGCSGRQIGFSTRR